jgi:hypothetical protein
MKARDDGRSSAGVEGAARKPRREELAVLASFAGIIVASIVAAAALKRATYSVTPGRQ